MKTTALFLFLSLVMMGCKDEKNEVPPENKTQEIKAPEQQNHQCLTLEHYEALSTIEDKADWLRKYGKAVCESIIFEATKKTHSIETGKFTAKPNGSLKKTWNDIKSITSQYSIYDKYVSFDIDTVNKKIKDIKIVPVFSDKTPCYSLALFRAIAKENNNSNISFEFIFAHVKIGETIIIKVTDMNGKVSYFDYSDEPKGNPGPISRRRIKSPL